MATPIYPQNVGAAISVTSTVAVTSNGYSASADKLTIANPGALMCDFELDATFGAAPVAGSIQLVAVDWSLDGVTAGPAPSSALQPRMVGTFKPAPLAGNTATSILMRLPGVALSPKADYYLYNNNTGQSLSIGAVLKAQPWTPGT